MSPRGCATVPRKGVQVKVVFLDFYGGPMDGSKERRKTRDGALRLDPGCAALINELHRRTGAVVVITSDSVADWRDEESPDAPHWWEESYPAAKQDLIEAGMIPEIIIGCIYQPPKSVPLYDRGKQIRVWLDEHRDVEGFVILDDKPLPVSAKNIALLKKHGFDPGCEPDYELGVRFVQVDDDTGLTHEDIDKATEILRKPRGKVYRRLSRFSKGARKKK